MSPRLRTNLAAVLRAIAKWLGMVAESLEPIKINRSIGVLTQPMVTYRFTGASKESARQAIEKPRG